jgi:hypothetical protein
MQTAPMDQIIFWICKAHTEILELVEGCSDEQLAWQPHPSATSLAFNIWHLARWADVVQSCVPDATPVLHQRLGPRPQIWHAEELAAAWGLDPASLGLREGGTGMESAAASLQLPGKAALVDYLRRSYALEEQAIAAIDEQQFQERRQDHTAPPDQTVGYWLMNHLIHEWEHLGNMRCLAGLHALNAPASP